MIAWIAKRKYWYYYGVLVHSYNWHSVFCSLRYFFLLKTIVALDIRSKLYLQGNTNFVSLSFLFKSVTSQKKKSAVAIIYCSNSVAEFDSLFETNRRQRDRDNSI